MKPEKLSPKALNIMKEMSDQEKPVRSQDLSFMDPANEKSRDWALSTMRRLSDMGFLEGGPRIAGAQSFSLTEAGKLALNEQLPTPCKSLAENDQEEPEPSCC